LSASNERAPILVIGAGIIGTFSALELRRAGYEVTLVDEKDPGEGCSAGNAGLLSPGAVVPYSCPESLRSLPRWLLDPLSPLSIRPWGLAASLPWLLSWMRFSTPARSLATGRAMMLLHGPSLERYREVLAEAGRPDLVRQEGQLYVSRRPEAFREDHVTRTLREEAGVETLAIGRDGLRELVPALAPTFQSGLLLPKNGNTVSSLGLVRCLARHFAALGGRILRGRAQELVRDGERVTGVRVGAEILAAREVVIAAGIDSAAFARAFGVRAPLQAERGYHLMLTDPRVDVPLPISNKDHGFAITPMTEGLRLAGTSEITPPSASPRWQRAAILGRLAAEMFPGLSTGASTRWFGSRPSLPDGLPMLGRAPGAANLVFAFGNGHFGMTAAPCMASVVTSIIDRRPPPIDIFAMRPERFG
jgi:D-amino-acid dehydrogenase